MSESELPQLGIAHEQFLALLDEARSGSAQSLGRLIDACRAYLLAIANQELPEALRAKIGPSDLVQDSCLEAQQGFGQFNGRTREELFAWLRGILVFNISNARRHFLETEKRQAGLEVSLNDSKGQDGSPWRLSTGLPSPSQEAIANEEQVLVEKALARLPEHLREAVLLRNREHLSFAEIGERMGRTSEAARKLWARGIEKLQQELKAVRSDSHEQRP